MSAFAGIAHGASWAPKANGTCEREAVTARTKYTEFRIDVGVATGNHKSRRGATLYKRAR